MSKKSLPFLCSISLHKMDQTSWAYSSTKCPVSRCYNVLKIVDIFFCNKPYFDLSPASNLYLTGFYFPRSFRKPLKNVLFNNKMQSNCILIIILDCTSEHSAENQAVFREKKINFCQINKCVERLS